MKSIFLFISLIISIQVCVAQTDSSLVYLDANGKETTKDSAFTYVSFHKKDNLWHAKEYFMRNQVLKSEGDFTEMNFNTPVGSFQNYNEDGILDRINVFNNGQLTERTFYHKNGNKKSQIVYNNNGVIQQSGWDESGKEIPGYIVERQAQFKGGIEKWVKYLEKNLNSKVAVEAGAPAGSYPVTVEFTVSKAGTVTNIKTISIPADCKPCATEAKRVILEGPEWTPAIQNNKPVIFHQRQTITFVVNEAKGRKKN